MTRQILIAIIASMLCRLTMAQAVFSSLADGSWSDPGIWMLQSGATSTGYPVAGDTVTITGGNVVSVNSNSQCGQLSVNSASSLLLATNTSVLTVSNGVALSSGSTLNISQGAMTVTGTFTITGASGINMSQGALTVVGLVAVSAPAAVGKTLVSVSGGIFTCAGGLSITGINATRQAELQIGNSAVNVVGSLLAPTANARINFTGSGTLTLAGIINIPDAASFIPGTGRVIYVGIPGTEQVVAALNYYRLAIAGTGSGLKKIQGTVSVTDSLSLVNDTLIVDGGSLFISDNATVVRTAGKLLSPPDYAGAINLVYNNFARDTTGAELPASASVLQDLTVDAYNGIVLSVSCSVNGVLKLLTGGVYTDGNLLTITDGTGGVSSDPAVERTSGFVSGTISRSIDASTGIRIFPFGTGAAGAYREWRIEYTTAPSSAGVLQVRHLDMAAAAQSGLPLADGASEISSVYPVYWQADASGGLAGGTYSLQITGGEIPGISNPSLLRIIKRPGDGSPWEAQGTAGANSGTASLPLITRSGLTGFSQFALGQSNSPVLPVHFLSFTGRYTNGGVDLYWATAAETDIRDYTVLHSSDGSWFDELGSLPPGIPGQASSSYSYRHAALPAGNHYYRIRENDHNGAFTYSAVIRVSVPASSSLTVRPTVATGQLHVSGIERYPALLFDASGNFLCQLNSGYNDISGLVPGLYYVRVQGQLARFIKLR